MHKSIVTLSTLFLAHTYAQANQAPTVSVTHFDDETQSVITSCRGWHFSGQGQVRTQFEGALTKAGVRLVERRAIRQIHSDEHELPNLDQSTRPKAARFKSAEFTLTGGITELGICADSGEFGAQLGGIFALIGGPPIDLSVQKQASVSKVTTTAQLVLVETGEVLASFSGVGEVTESGIGFGAGVAGVGINTSSKKEPPIEAAARMSAENLANQVAEFLRARSR